MVLKLDQVKPATGQDLARVDRTSCQAVGQSSLPRGHSNLTLVVWSRKDLIPEADDWSLLGVTSLDFQRKDRLDLGGDWEHIDKKDEEGDWELVSDKEPHCDWEHVDDVWEQDEGWEQVGIRKALSTGAPANDGGVDPKLSGRLEDKLESDSRKQAETESNELAKQSCLSSAGSAALLDPPGTLSDLITLNSTCRIKDQEDYVSNNIVRRNRDLEHSMSTESKGRSREEEDYLSTNSLGKNREQDPTVSTNSMFRISEADHSVSSSSKSRISEADHSVSSSSKSRIGEADHSVPSSSKSRISEADHSVSSSSKSRISEAGHSVSSSSKSRISEAHHSVSSSSKSTQSSVEATQISAGTDMFPGSTEVPVVYKNGAFSFVRENTNNNSPRSSGPSHRLAHKESKDEGKPPGCCCQHSQNSALRETDVQLPPGYPVYDILEVKLHQENRKFDYITADGNCFFRAISKGFYGSENFYKTVRKHIVEKIAQNKSQFAQFIDGEDVEDHINMMSQNHCWATTCEIYAAATLLQKDIYMLAPDHLNENYSWLLFRPVFEINDPGIKCDQYCYVTLCNTNGNHYDRVVPDHGGCNCFLPHPPLGRVGAP